MTERTDWELRLLAGHAALRMLRDIRDFGHSNGLPFAWETVPALTETEHRRFTGDAVDWLVGLLCSSLATVEHIHDLDMGAIVEDATLTSPITLPPPGEGLERVVLEGGELVVAHTAERCDGAPCPIHHRSDHHMRGWRQHWRDDRWIMERVCPHGVGHPDPDEPRIASGKDAGIHGCDGCCTPAGETPCAVCGLPVDTDDAHTVHQCGGAETCGCDDFAHPGCCPDCEEAPNA